MTEKVKKPRTGRIQSRWCTSHPLLALQKIYKRSDYQAQCIDIPITVRSTIWPDSHLYGWIDMRHFIFATVLYILVNAAMLFTVPSSFALLWKIGFPEDDPLRKQSHVSRSATAVIVPSIKILSPQNLNRPHWLQQFSSASVCETVPPVGRIKHLIRLYNTASPGWCSPSAAISGPV